MPATLDITAIGNPIMDVLSHVEAHVIENLGLHKGSMSLIDEAKGNALYESLGESIQSSGGSAANTIAGMAQLGATCGFIGKVKADALGAAFRHDLRANGVEFSTPAAQDGPGTGRCLVYVTPEGERTMATYLGACTTLTPADIDEALISRSKMLYIEGYLWDGPHAIAAIEKALSCAEGKGVKTSFTLSDTFCVSRHREDFLKLFNRVDVLFANEAEACALHGVNTLAEAIGAFKTRKGISFITCSAGGAVVVEGGKATPVETKVVKEVVDTTGAGDLFAAGALYGLSRGQTAVEATKLGNIMAGHIIQQLGARSQTPLAKLVA